MNFKNTLSMVLMTAVSILASGLIAPSFAAAEEYNCEDPKCQQEKLRMADPKTMNAQALTRGIPCETGACFQSAEPSLGTDPQVIIEPAGDAAAKPTKTGTTPTAQ